MELFYSSPFIRTDADALRFFKMAVKYRGGHKDEYSKIARFVFDSTHQMITNVEPGSDVDWLRLEFIALEAPGMPQDDNTDPDKYVDGLWLRLDKMIDKTIAMRAAG
jgi:hypothetical protein